MSLTTLKDKVEQLIEKAQSGDGKPEQEKSVDIVKNGTTEVLPDKGNTLSKVLINVEVPTAGGTEELENLIDKSGVLDSTDGTVEDKVEQLIDKAQWEQIWYEQSGTWTNQLGSLFVGSEKIPRLNFENCTVFRGCLKGNNAERIDYYINCGKATDINRALQDCKKLKFLYGIDGSNARIWSATFSGCTLLETIQEPLNFQSATSADSVFQNCNALKDVRFVPETIKVSITIPSPVLSAESIQSIIDGLAVLVVGATRTLTLHADAKIMQSQVDSANAKGWTIAGGTVVSEEEYYG